MKGNKCPYLSTKKPVKEASLWLRRLLSVWWHSTISFICIDIFKASRFNHLWNIWNINEISIKASQTSSRYTIYSGWILLTLKNSSAKLHHCLQKEAQSWHWLSLCTQPTKEQQWEHSHTGVRYSLAFFAFLPFLCSWCNKEKLLEPETDFPFRYSVHFRAGQLKKMKYLYVLDWT